MALITCHDVTLGYEGTVLVEDLNFEIGSGDYLCILGENGSGKSTLIRTLLHLQDPVKGTVTEGDGLRKNEIGYLPQQTLVQKDFPASVEEIVLSGCLGRSGFRPFYTKEEKALAGKNMERLGILDLKKRCYRELSGGQQQRVLLARSLCATQKILLLDEPVSGLDPKAALEMYDLIAQLNRESGITVIMVTHDMVSIRYATHILHIGDGWFFGTKDEYLSSPAGSSFAGLYETEQKEGE